jgi:hypothetical protein
MRQGVFSAVKYKVQLQHCGYKLVLYPDSVVQELLRVSFNKQGVGVGGWGLHSGILFGSVVLLGFK